MRNPQSCACVVFTAASSIDLHRRRESARWWSPTSRQGQVIGASFRWYWRAGEISAETKYWMTGLIGAPDLKSPLVPYPSNAHALLLPGPLPRQSEERSAHIALATILVPVTLAADLIVTPY